MTTYSNQYFPQIAFHPGETLAEKLEELGMGPKEFAIRSGKPEKTVSAILKGTSSITPEMAVMFEHVLKIPARFWLNLQRTYDEYLAREERYELLKESIDWAKKFPIGEMIKKGWLKGGNSLIDKTSELLSFFGISSHKAWEDYYLNQELKVAFRISLVHTKEPYAISAWLRRGELQASELKANEYSESKFKESLSEIKNLMAKHPKDFFGRMQKICLEAGVKVVPTACLPKAPSCGATRWINDTPVIQMSDRYKRNDIFWFTFFHEAGHILLHGKKDIFLEQIEYSELDLDKEKEADAFAQKWTLTEDEQMGIVAALPLNEQMIIQFAREYNTHPAIIIGRLQHLGLVKYSVGRKFIEPLEFS